MSDKTDIDFTGPTGPAGPNVSYIEPELCTELVQWAHFRFTSCGRLAIFRVGRKFYCKDHDPRPRQTAPFCPIPGCNLSGTIKVGSDWRCVRHEHVGGDDDVPKTKQSS